MNKVQILEEIGESRIMHHEVIEEGDPKKLQLFRCPNDGHMHFRHAGYVMPMMPYSDEGKVKVSSAPAQVMICIKCKHAFVHYRDKFHDVTDQIDLEAWKETELKAHEQTGVGGQC